MTDRRQFLQTAAVLSAAPLAGHAAFAGAGGSPIALDGIVIDARHQPARDFGARAARFGTPLLTMEGDITGLWQRELLGRWRSRPGALVGLTERPALFLLERLGFDHGLRVAFQAEHASVAGGAGAHRLLRSADTMLESELGAAGADWPAVLAEALVTGQARPVADARPTDAALAAHLGEAPKLHSWIIAPRQAA